MMKLKQSSWSLNTKRNVHWLCFLFLTVALVSCKKLIYSVDVRVYNVDTNEGIPNIQLFTESGGEYTTDDDGRVTIKGEGNLYGQKINTRLTVDGYTHPDYFNSCEPRTTYEFQEQSMEIPLFKNNYIQVTAVKKESNPSGSSCILFDNWPCIGGTAEQYVLKSDGGLSLPRFSDGNTRTIFLANNANEQTIKIFYNSNCDNLEIDPDTSFTVPIVKGDTTKITVYI